MIGGVLQFEPGRIVRMTQFAIAAMIMGVATFGIVVVVVLRPDAGNGFMITYGSIVFTVIMMGARLVVPGLVVNTIRKRIAAGTWQLPGRKTSTLNTQEKPLTDQTMLAAMFMSKTIAGAAMLEGAAFFTIIAYMLEGQIASLVASGILLFFLILSFPTKNSADQWFEDQARRIEELRQFAGYRAE